jgi:hypothetical protein
MFMESFILSMNMKRNTTYLPDAPPSSCVWTEYSISDPDLLTSFQRSPISRSIPKKLEAIPADYQWYPKIGMFHHGPEDISPDMMINKLKRLQRENRILKVKLQALEGKGLEQSHSMKVIENQYVPSYYSIRSR